jgi:hypothetical protein
MLVCFFNIYFILLINLFSFIFFSFPFFLISRSRKVHLDSHMISLLNDISHPELFNGWNNCGLDFQHNTLEKLDLATFVICTKLLAKAPSVKKHELKRCVCYYFCYICMCVCILLFLLFVCVFVEGNKK